MSNPLRRTLGRIKRSIFQTNHASWYCRAITAADSSAAEVVEKDITEINLDDYDNLVHWLSKKAAEYPWIYNQREIEYAAKYDHLYSAIYYKGEIAGYAKVALRKAYIEDYYGSLPLAEDEAFIYDTFTLPGLQKKQLASRLLGKILDHLQQSHVAFVYCHIPDWNKASRKLYEKLGFRKIAHVRYLRLINWEYFTNNPLSVMQKGRQLFSENQTSSA